MGAEAVGVFGAGASSRLRFKEVLTMTTMLQPEFGVFVHAYQRVRFGCQEYVCAHWRSWPNR